MHQHTNDASIALRARVCGRAIGRPVAFLVALSLICGLFAALSIATAPAAHADNNDDGDCTICTVVQGSGDIPDDAWDPDPGANPPGGGDGTLPANFWDDRGSGRFKDNSVAPSNLRDIRQGAFAMASGSVSRPYGNQCGTPTSPADYVWHVSSQNNKRYSDPMLGWSYHRGGLFFPETGTPTSYRMDWGGYTCIHPATYAEDTVYCPSYAEDTLYGPVGNPAKPASWANPPAQPYDDGIYNDSNPRAGIYLSKWALDKTNPRKCQKTFTHAASVNAARNPIVTSPQHMGQWELYSQLYVQTCIYRDYKDNDIDDKIRAGTCSADAPANPVQFSQAQDRTDFTYTCKAPYLVKGWLTGYTFTMKDCPSEWQCSADPAYGKPGSLNGVAGTSFSLLNDGKTRSLSWTAPKPTGNVTVTGGETGWLNFISGSPQRSGNINSDTQPYQFTRGLGEALGHGFVNKVEDGDKAIWDFSFYAAGVPGEPFVVQPHWEFDGSSNLKFPTADLATWDGDPNHTDWINIKVDEHYPCDGAEVALNIYKPRISNH